MSSTTMPLAEVKEIVESVVMRTVEIDMPLIESGLVDSVLAVEIVLRVEAVFGVHVPPTEIAEYLATVQALAAFVAENR